MAVRSRPAASRAERIARTCPSIMAEGATTSAPARAWETAVRASRGRAASLSTSAPPSGAHRSGPQCPWSVYSHRQVSAMTSSPGAADLMAAMPRCTTPSSAHAPDPRASFRAGIPKTSTAGTPFPARAAAYPAASSIGRWYWPGMEGISRAETSDS